MLLVSVCGFAQSNTPVRGDVNKDGTVDEQDILAILQIMQNSGGIGGAKTYYWYVGKTNPSTMTEISPIVNDNTSSGWRLIGNTLPTAGTTLFDGTGSIDINSSKVTYYFAVNSTDINLGIYDSLGNEDTQFVTGPTQVNGWNVYTTTFTSKSFNNVLKVK